MCCDEPVRTPEPGHRYVLGWSFWFDDGTEWPRRYSSLDGLTPAALPEDGCQGGIAHFSDGTRRNLQGSNVYGISTHPCGEPVFHQVGIGEMTRSDIERELHDLKDRYPNGFFFSAKDTCDLVLKRAVDAAMSERL